ncbi:hypothetical protein G9A89_008722 [Geosiphon pyriformis]|nr:hypothetical protein G9A89_008722 [Geosiphon pyriformis]
MWSLVDYILQFTPYSHLAGKLHPFASLIIAIGLLSIGYIMGYAALAKFLGRSQFKPAGKHAYITGGSLGLGRAIGVLLAKKGASVTIVARDRTNLNEALEEIKAARVNEQQIFHAISADVTIQADSINALDEASSKHNGQVPDFIIACAGSSTPGIFIDQPVSDFENGMKLNYFGTLYTVHEGAKRMAYQGVKGKIILISSVLGFVGFIGYSQYAPTKYAIRGLADCLRNELLLYDIGVHCYFPGTIMTPGFENENKTKPKITRIIEGEDDGSTPEQCAKALYKGLEKDNYCITSDLIGDVLRASTRGIQPTNNFLLDSLLCSISWLISGPARMLGDKKVKDARSTIGNKAAGFSNTAPNVTGNEDKADAKLTIMFRDLAQRLLKSRSLPPTHHPHEIPTSKIPKTGQLVSRLGFGGYRVNTRDPRCRDALHKALEQGINVIDTSSHFEQGDSERMIGEVLEKELIGDRKKPVIISKSGYIQLRDTLPLNINTRYAKLNQKTAHCIASDFLEAEITQSLKRLRVDKIDLWMINNPERMVKAQNQVYSMERLYREITEACVYLNEECRKGRIGGYGICSNSMAIPSASDHISLPKILSNLPPSTRHNFVAIQVPLNMFEQDILVGEESQSLADIAKINDIFLFTNRPLQAITGGIIRTLTNHRDLVEDKIFENLEAGFIKVSELENNLNGTFPIGHPISTKFAWAQVLAENLTRLSKNYFAAQHYLDTQIRPAIDRDSEELRGYLDGKVSDDENENDGFRLDKEEKVKLCKWIDNYSRETKSLLNHIKSHARAELLSTNDELDRLISTICPQLSTESYSSSSSLSDYNHLNAHNINWGIDEFQFEDDNDVDRPNPLTRSKTNASKYYSPLSVKALRIVLSDARVGCALVGMRRPEYVGDAIAALILNKKEGDSMQWEGGRTWKEVVEEVQSWAAANQTK